MLSAFFSSMEAAYSNLSKTRLRHYVEENKRGSKKAMYIVENLDKAISTVLLFNLIARIAAVSIAAKLLTDNYGSSLGLTSTIAGMTIVLWIVAIMIPRTYGKEHAETYSLKIAFVMLGLMWVLTPINALLGILQQSLTKTFSKGRISTQTITEDEIKAIVEISEEEGVIEKEEKELVYRSLDFDEILVGEVLTPRPDMIAVEVNQTIDQIKQTFFKERLSRIPVYEKDIDNIIGILSEREFFAELLQHDKVDIRSLLRKPKFVVKSMQISALLLDLQKSNVHMSIVIDEFGGTAGLITLEDILEQLVGDIWDEHDEVINLISQLDETTYEVSPQITLDEFEKTLNIEPLESDYYNLGGWIFGNIDRIPQKGDSFAYEHVTVTVAEVEKKRVKKLLVKVREPELGAEV